MILLVLSLVALSTELTSSELKSIDAPITKVAVMSGQAEVTRSAHLALGTGLRAFRVADLPDNLDPGSIRISLSGDAKLLRVQSEKSALSVLSFQNAEQSLNGFEQAQDALAQTENEISEWRKQFAWVRQLQPVEYISESDRKGQSLPPLKMDEWLKTTKTMAEWQQALTTRIHDLESTRDAQRKTRDTLAQKLAAFAPLLQARQVTHVTFYVKASAAGSANVQISYRVSGAKWLPAYDLRYSSRDQTMFVQRFAVLEQATGEAWQKVDATFSTLAPSDRAVLPQLNTWTLGESLEWRPIVQAMTPPSPTGVTRATPSRATPSRTTSHDEWTQVLLRERLSTALATSALAKQKGKANTYEFESDAIEGEVALKDSADMATRSRRAAPAPVLAARDDDAVFAVMSESSHGSAAQVTSSSVSYRQAIKSLAFDQAIPQKPALMPGSVAYDAAGLNYAFDAKAPLSLDSNGAPARVPLGSEKFKVTTSYDLTPGIALTAYMKASVQSPGTTPLLRGHAALYTNDRFVGEVDVGLTEASGTIDFPMGADEDIRAKRRVEATTVTKGVIIKDDVTHYKVTIDVTNFKAQPVTVNVYEPIPKSSQDKTKIDRGTISPPAQEDKAGIQRFVLTLAPGKTQTIEINYDITRPKNFVIGN